MRRRHYRFWTPEEIELLREIYPDEPSALIASFFGVDVHRIYAAANRNGMAKSAEYLASERSGRIRRERGMLIGARYGFQKGHVPSNKGLRRPGWSAGRMAETQFKPGASLNRMPLGSTRDIDGYLYRKISEVPKVPYTVNWKLEHVLLWEAVNGPVPGGHALCFRDGNRKNLALENFELLSRTELMRRNTIHLLPEPLKSVIRLNASLRRRIRRIDEEQDVRSA